MAKRGLVVVESPTKVKTIAKYLDGKYVVKASMGHVRDLPKSQLGVDPKKNFKPKYVVTPSKKKVLEDLVKASEKADTLYVATDPEGLFSVMLTWKGVLTALAGLVLLLGVLFIDWKKLLREKWHGSNRSGVVSPRTCRTFGSHIIPITRRRIS